MRAKKPIYFLYCLLPAVGWLVLLASCSGGGPRLVPVKGKLTNAGKPVTPNKKGGVTINLAPVPATGKTYSGMFNPDDDTFEVAGPDNKGIPEGKYKVAISLMSITASSEIDAINQKYTYDKTPIEVEVKGPVANVDIDLAKFK
jgi:hypothetical protein